MDKLEKKFKTYLAMTSGVTISMVILGLILFFMPGTSLDIIRWIVTSCLIAAGLYSLMAFGSFIGVLILVLGAVVALNPGVINIIPVILGAYVLLTNIVKLIGLSSLKSTSFGSFVVTTIFSVIGVVCGAIMIAHPDATNVTVMRVIGIVMLVYGVSDFVDVLILRRQVLNYSKLHGGTAAGSRRGGAERERPATKNGTRIADIPEAKVVRKKRKR